MADQILRKITAVVVLYPNTPIAHPTDLITLEVANLDSGITTHSEIKRSDFVDTIEHNLTCGVGESVKISVYTHSANNVYHSLKYEATMPVPNQSQPAIALDILASVNLVWDTI